MPSSFSTDLKLELMVTGENAGTWGTKTNTNLNLLQQAIAGYQEISIAGGAQTTALTMDNAAISNARNAVIKLTGTITGNQIVTVPNGIEKTYIVSNGTTGAFTVEFKTVSGTGPTFSTTDKGIKILFADGTNVVDVNANLSASSFPQINDSNGNEEIKFTTTASAVNELTIANAATGNAPEISATGSDTNIDLKITPKGTGKINLDGIKFPNADGSAGQALVTNGLGVLSFADAGRTGTVNWDTTKKTTGFTAVSGVGYFCDTTSAAFTVTLPATPAAGDIVAISDYANTSATNNITVGRNGSLIDGEAVNATIKVNGQVYTLLYVDATKGWKTVDQVFNQITTKEFIVATGGTETTSGDFKIHTFTGPGTFTVSAVGNPAGSTTVDYLVVAGGGGAGSGLGGGGGAGGYRTNFPSPSTTGLPVSVQGYPITVGSGGAAGTPDGGAGGNGNPSVFSTITSTAGGGSVARPPGPVGPGGSGGGSAGAQVVAGGTGNSPPVSPSQGNPGGQGTNASNRSGGGGGGAGGSGGNAGSGVYGTGGVGSPNSITGSAVFYAGGGGGNGDPGGPSASGAGGNGGGGQGGPSSPGTAGTANTGGGGGGGGAGSPNGSQGGSGIVIIRYKYK